MLADQTKTEHLSVQAEIDRLESERLEKQRTQPPPGTDNRASAADDAPATLAPSTRRGLLGWIAPVILSLGTALKAGTAQAGTTDDFVETVPSGRCLPTPAASSAPEASPSSTVPPTAEASPSSTVAPTAEASPSPTMTPAPPLAPRPDKPPVSAEPVASAGARVGERSKLT